MKHRIAKIKQTQKQTQKPPQNGYSPSYGCGYLWNGISNWHREFKALASEEKKIAKTSYFENLHVWGPNLHVFGCFFHTLQVTPSSNHSQQKHGDFQPIFLKNKLA